MADTLEEIYRATLSESDFNSNGVKEIFTTNSSTRYMLKDVQVVNSSTDIPVKADLTINDVKVASVDASVSGTEIVGVSSSVKIDTSTFPLNYEDQYFAISNTSRNLQKNITPLVNGVSDTSLSGIKTTTTLYNSYPSNAYVGVWQDVGPNNVSVQIIFDRNSSTQYNIYNSSGTNIASNYDNYSPKAFDQRRYIYWLPQGTNMKRYDVWNNTTTNIPYTLGTANPSTYPLFAYAGNGYFFGWTNYSSSSTGDRPFVFNSSDNSFVDVSQGNPASTAFNVASDMMFAVHSAQTNTMKVLRVNNDSNWTEWTIDYVSGGYSGGDTRSASPNMWTAQQNMDVFNNKLYYYSNTAKICYYDPDTEDFTDTGLNFTSNSPYTGKGHLSVGFETPSSSTVSSRSYTIIPSVTYRVTGVKST